jgi:hypothetical protein
MDELHNFLAKEAIRHWLVVVEGTLLGGERARMKPFFVLQTAKVKSL